jgi:hypothetical protein
VKPTQDMIERAQQNGPQCDCRAVEVLAAALEGYELAPFELSANEQRALEGPAAVYERLDLLKLAVRRAQRTLVPKQAEQPPREWTADDVEVAESDFFSFVHPDRGDWKQHPKQALAAAMETLRWRLAPAAPTEVLSDEEVGALDTAAQLFEDSGDVDAQRFINDVIERYRSPAPFSNASAPVKPEARVDELMKALSCGDCSASEQMELAGRLAPAAPVSVPSIEARVRVIPDELRGAARAARSLDDPDLAQVLEGWAARVSWALADVNAPSAAPVKPEDYSDEQVKAAWCRYTRDDEESTLDSMRAALAAANVPAQGPRPEDVAAHRRVLGMLADANARIAELEAQLAAQYARADEQAGLHSTALVREKQLADDLIVARKMWSTWQEHAQLRPARAEVRVTGSAEMSAESARAIGEIAGAPLTDEEIDAFQALIKLGGDRKHGLAQTWMVPLAENALARFIGGQVSPRGRPRSWSAQDLQAVADEVIGMLQRPPSVIGSMLEVAGRVLDIAAYRLAPAAPVKPEDYSEEQVHSALSVYHEFDAGGRWCDEDTASMRAALAAASVPAQPEKSISLPALEYGKDERGWFQIAGDGTRHDWDDPEEHIASLEAQLAAQSSVEPLTEEEERYVSHWENVEHQLPSRTELINIIRRRCLKPEPKKQNIRERFWHRISRHKLAGDELQALEELYALAEQGEIAADRPAKP